ncbi:hypothetical protein LTR53_018718, partial [Teratosphaeriaceae sp. CCFEE 6253]
MSKLPQDYTREVAALEREVLKHQPTDVLQFCSNFFHRRLESQRAEVHLQQRHHSGAGGGGGSSMAESSFPGSNPFGHGAGAPSGAPAVGGGSGMHSLAEEEEEEHALQSPTASSFPPNARSRSEEGGAPDEDDNN